MPQTRSTCSLLLNNDGRRPGCKPHNGSAQSVELGQIVINAESVRNMFVFLNHLISTNGDVRYLTE